MAGGESAQRRGAVIRRHAGRRVEDVAAAGRARAGQCRTAPGARRHRRRPGWPRRSAEEIEIAASLVPEDKAAQISLVESDIRRRHWTKAHFRIAELAAIYPNDVHVRRVQNDLRAHNDFELQTEFRINKEYGGNSSDGNPTGNSPGSGTDWTARLYSPPLAESWRFLGGWEHHTAKTTDGQALRYRFGGGVELALPDLTVEAIAWNNHGDISEPGASLAVAWVPTDHWRFDLGAELFAGDTPLRAVLNDITANSAGVGVTYTWHESRSLALGVSGYDFSDGNRRAAAHLNFAQKVVDIPHFDLTLRPEIYTSTNSSSDGPYFSPSRDLSGALTGDAEHVIWRRYDRSFGHRLAVTGGAYWQEHFGNVVDRLDPLRAGLSIQSLARTALGRQPEARCLRWCADAFHRRLRPPESSLLMLRRALLFLLVMLALTPARAADRFASRLFSRSRRLQR